jgi:hypothetical protein
MKKLLFAFLIAWIAVGLLSAQQATAVDYEIRNISRVVSGEEVIVQFEVTNLGGAVETPVTAWLLTADTQEALDSAEVPPLAQGAPPYAVTLSFPVTRFPAATVQRLVATAGARELPPEFERQRNIARFTVTIPDYSSAAAQAAPASGVQLPVDIDSFDPLTVALIVAGVGIALILLWLLTIILRVLFERPATFPQWQIPYAAPAYVDQNSAAGRRQLWQQHAQNDAAPFPCQAGSYHVTKRLIGTDGVKLSGWRVDALRLSQYDMYGRVSRSVIVAERGAARAIDRAMRRSAKLDEKAAERAVRGAVKRLTDAFFKHVNKRNSMLPIALDMRLHGAHGDVQIVFRLDQCVNGAWQQLDEWQPELVVTGGQIQENFTYTFFGMRQDETPRQFRKRLRADVTLTLARLVTGKNPAPPAPQTAPSMPAMLAEPIPGDTTPVAPVTQTTGTPAANQS